MQKIPYYQRRGAGEIPNGVAEPQFKEDIEASPFLISFYYYNDKECEIKDLQKSAPRRLLQDIRRIGGITNQKDFHQHNIGSEPVYRSGEYLKLFNRLPEDIELKEHKIQGSSRLFYFLTIDKKFNIVAITNRHYETKKNRR